MAWSDARIQRKRERKAARRNERRYCRRRREASMMTERWRHATRKGTGWSAASIINFAPLINMLTGKGSNPRADKSRNRRGI